jgi:hypothetical protein
VRKGRHYVAATLKGFETVGRAVEFKTRSSRNVSLKLSEATRDSRLEGQAAAAIAAMDGPELPGEARQLLDTFRANRVVLLAATRNDARLVMYDANGGHRRAANRAGAVDDLPTARSAARSLLGGTDRRNLASAGDDAGDDENGGDPTSVAAAPAGGSRSTGKAGSHARDSASSETGSSWDSVSSGGSTPSATRRSGAFYLFSANPTKEMTLYAAYGGGALLATVGGVFGALGLAAQNEYYKEANLEGAKIDHEGTTDQVEGQDVAAAGRRDALIADILFGAAGAAIITGLILHLAWEPDEPTATAAGRPDQGSAAGWSYDLGPGYLRVDF